MRISDWSSDVCSSDLYPSEDRMMDANPFSPNYSPPPVDDQPEPAPKAAAKPAPLITEPGAYPDIDIDDYPHNANLLPGPSLSASGAKTTINRSTPHLCAANTPTHRSEERRGGNN